MDTETVEIDSPSLIGFVSAMKTAVTETDTTVHRLA